MGQYVNIVTPHNQIRLLFDSEFSITDGKVRKVVMGDNDITEECLGDGKVHIPSVSETVVIYY